MRAAIYFTPPADDPLAIAAAAWLGRDAFTGAATRSGDARLDPLVADPARYGFHATMRAPFRLREGFTLDDVRAALSHFAARQPAHAIGTLVLQRLGSFLALVPERTPDALRALESAVVEAFEPFRAPLTPEDVARRGVHRLSERQRELLDRWGYPYVREEFRFHMTLTGALPDPELSRIEDEARLHFAPFLGKPLGIGGLGLFVEREPGGPFVVDRLTPLAG